MPFPSSGADDAFDYLFKIILIGDSNVGKTCVVHRFKTGQYHEKQQNTIGVDFTVRSMDIDGKKVKVGGRSEPKRRLLSPRCRVAVPAGAAGRTAPPVSAPLEAAGKIRLPSRPGALPRGGEVSPRRVPWGTLAHPHLGTCLPSWLLPTHPWRGLTLCLQEVLL